MGKHVRTFTNVPSQQFSSRRKQPISTSSKTQFINIDSSSVSKILFAISICSMEKTIEELRMRKCQKSSSFMVNFKTNFDSLKKTPIVYDLYLYNTIQCVSRPKRFRDIAFLVGSLPNSLTRSRWRIHIEKVRNFCKHTTCLVLQFSRWTFFDNPEFFQENQWIFFWKFNSDAQTAAQSYRQREFASKKWLD